MARVGMNDSRERARGTRWFIAALAFCAFNIAAGTAIANEQLTKAPRDLIACEDPSLIRNFHRLLQAGDNKASYDYLMDIVQRPGCAPISKGEDIYLSMIDVLDKGIQSGLQEGLASVLSDALGFKIPTQVQLVRIRKAGETVWRHAMLQSVL